MKLNIGYFADGPWSHLAFEKLIKDTEFTNMLSGRRIWKVDIINTYKELIDESLQLSRMIDQELKRRE